MDEDIVRRRYTHARIEACSVCQLRCPSCPTGAGRIPASSTGYLKPENFAKFLELNPYLEEVALSDYGEIYLNPKIEEIFKIAHDKGVKTTAEVNLNDVKDSALEATVKYGVKTLTVSLDGASQETHGKYRIRGNFDKVIENVKRINYYKEKYKTRYPVLKWQFVLFAHNEHEFEIAEAMAKDLNMKWKPKKSWDKEFSVSTRVDKLTVKPRWDDVPKAPSTCRQLWTQISIGFDGSVLGCCVNYSTPFQGNAFEDDLYTLSRKHHFVYAKSMVQGLLPPKSGIACTACPIYNSMVKKGNFHEIYVKQI